MNSLPSLSVFFRLNNFSSFLPPTGAWGYHRQGSCQAGFGTTLTQVRYLCSLLIYLSTSLAVCLRVSLINRPISVSLSECLYTFYQSVFRVCLSVYIYLFLVRMTVCFALPLSHVHFIVIPSACLCISADLKGSLIIRPIIAYTPHTQ